MRNIVGLGLHAGGNGDGISALRPAGGVLRAGDEGVPGAPGFQARPPLPASDRPPKVGPGSQGRARSGGGYGTADPLEVMLGPAYFASPRHRHRHPNVGGAVHSAAGQEKWRAGGDPAELTRIPFPAAPLGGDCVTAGQPGGGQVVESSEFPAVSREFPGVGRVHPMRHFRRLMRQKRATRKSLRQHDFSPHWRLSREADRKTAAKPPISGAKVTLSGADVRHFRARWRLGGSRQLPEAFRFSCEFPEPRWVTENRLISAAKPLISGAKVMPECAAVWRTRPQDAKFPALLFPLGRCKSARNSGKADCYRFVGGGNASVRTCPGGNGRA